MSLDAIVQRPARTLPPNATCAEAACLMRDENVGAVIVANGREPVGIVTDRDLAVRVVAEQRAPGDVLLGAVMSTHPAFLAKRRNLDEVISTMRQLGVRRLPVVDDAGNIDGILSLDDVLMLLARQLGEIGEAVRSELGVHAE
jgi:CBS domain-containing protein